MSDSTPSPAEPAPKRGVKTRIKKAFKWFLASVAVLLLLLTALRLILFSGPYQNVQSLPDRRIVDLHCHAAGIGAGDSGCFVSPELRANFRFQYYLDGFGVTVPEIEEHGDALVIDRIAEQVRRSRHLDAAVILAIDGVVDEQGELDKEATEFHVPNAFLARETARHPELYWGASVNPLRHDAIERLEWAKRNGAVLVKWLPGIMLMDPADPRFVSFYKKLVELDLPLLTHAGKEKSFTHARDELADPARLELALDTGVTVVVAHVASTGENEGEEDFVRLLERMNRYPNLYADISSLTQVNKLGYLRRALSDPRLKGRLLYGTDYPLINTPLVSPWFFPLNLSRKEMSELAGIENPFDRDIALKQALGVPAEIFARSAQFLSLPPIVAQ